MSNTPWSNPVGALPGTYVAGGTDVAVADGGTGASTAVTAGANLGFATKLSQWGVGVFMAPSGSMGNNGAITLGTALDRIYAEGIWLYLPAGAVAAGEPAAAAFRWCVMSSTTVGVVYNDTTFTGASIPVAGTATAYVTTGPGAYTGVTAATVAITMTVPANTLGATGTLKGDFGGHHNAAAGNKTFEVLYSTTGGTNYGYVGSTQAGGSQSAVVLRNSATNAQSGGVMAVYSGGISPLASGIKFGAADTTASTTVVWRLTNQTATNWMGVVGGSFFTAQ